MHSGLIQCFLQQFFFAYELGTLTGTNYVMTYLKTDRYVYVWWDVIKLLRIIGMNKVIDLIKDNCKMYVFGAL